MARHMAPQPEQPDKEAHAEAAQTPRHGARKHMAPAPAAPELDAVAAAPNEPDPEPAPAPEFAPVPESAPTSNVSPEFKPAPKRRRGNLVSNILIVVGVALLVAAGVIFFNNQRNYEKIDIENERVAEYARLSDSSEEPPDVDWDALKAINPDIVGWIYVPGTVVNYPVYQTDNNDYYLDHAPDKSQSIGGSVFLDFENTAPGMQDAQTIVYGHHMRNGSQFKQIADMENQELFDGIQTVWYVTEGGAYKLMPLFLFYTTEADTDVRQFKFQNDAEWRTYLKRYLGEARAKRADVDQAVAAVQHTLTLSTCNYEDGYGRSLLVCAPKYEVPGTAEYQTFQAANPKTQKAEQPASQDGTGEHRTEQGTEGEENTSEGESSEGDQEEQHNDESGESQEIEAE